MDVHHTAEHLKQARKEAGQNDSAQAPRQKAKQKSLQADLASFVQKADRKSSDQQEKAEETAQIILGANDLDPDSRRHLGFRFHRKKSASYDEELMDDAENESGAEYDWSLEAEKPAENRLEHLLKEARTKKWPFYARPGFWLLIVCACLLLWLVNEMMDLGLFSLSSILIPFGLGALLLGIAGYGFYFSGAKWCKALAVLLCLCTGAASIWGATGVHAVMHDLQAVCDDDGMLSDTGGIYCLKQAPVNSLEALKGMTLGVFAGKNETINTAVVQELADQGISVKTKRFDTYSQMMTALKGQAVRALILNSSDLELASEFPGLEQIKNQVTLMQSFPVTTAARNEPVPVNVSQEPFTMLVSVSDDPLDQENYRSSLNLLVTVNPKTRTVLSVYVPRNYYLIYACPEGMNCEADTWDKIGLSSYYSIVTLKDTIASAFGITINYTVRVDMKEVIDYIDKIGTVTVNNKTAYNAGGVNFDAGELELNAVSAARYATGSNDFSEEDAVFESNEMNLLTSVVTQAAKGSPAEVMDFLNAVSQGVRTNFSYSQLIRFLRLFYLHDYAWNDYTMAVGGTNSTGYSKSLADQAFVVLPDTATVDHAQKVINIVLDGEQPDESMKRE